MTHFCSPKVTHPWIRVRLRERRRRNRAVEAVERRKNSVIHAKGVEMIL